MTTQWLRRNTARHSFLICAVTLLGVCAFQLFMLKLLPNSTSWIEPSVLDERAPDPNFRVGSIEWDVSRYAREPQFEPLRAFFRNTCQNERGLKAAICVAEAIAVKFPFGKPAIDFFHPDYRVLDSFEAHVGQGQAGHCVSRSGLLVAILLANGLPARIVQTYALDNKGHNVVEVWDEQGWVMIDPLFSTTLRVEQKGQMSGYLLQKGFKVFSEKDVPKGIDLEDFYFHPQHGVLTGVRFYPEPWFYMRVGQRLAPWPFRGKFASVGRPTWDLGPAQTWLQRGIGFSALAAICCLLIGIVKYRNNRKLSDFPVATLRPAVRGGPR